MSGRLLRLAKAIAVIDVKEPEGGCFPGAEKVLEKQKGPGGMWREDELLDYGRAKGTVPDKKPKDLDLRAEDLANRLEEAVAAIGDCVAILKELGMDEGKAGDKILSIVRDETLGPERIPGGFSEGKPDSEFDPDQLEKGIKVELEHTGNIGVAKEVSKDHLCENKRYYDYLEEMEEKAEKKGDSCRLADQT